jgi:hypothetical protein
MTPKATGRAPSRSAPPATDPLPMSTTTPTRKPWKKKTPIDVVLDQINRLRQDVTEKEQELTIAKRQLQKLEEAVKVLEEQ